ncbi:hypothetical protein ACH3O9_11195 [Leeuwenhoekiella sp. A16]|uniref:Thoeris anti-defense Tad2 family protein n=1 Tax=Leeuwenhoekiella sp. A16 TaxID=3141462 RepID=UPI003A7FEC41
MNYAEAEDLSRKEKRLTRKAWPSGVFIRLFGAGFSKELEMITESVPGSTWEAFLVIKTATGFYKPFFPTEEDLNAFDWKDYDDLLNDETVGFSYEGIRSIGGSLIRGQLYVKRTPKESTDEYYLLPQPIENKAFGLSREYQVDPETLVYVNVKNHATLEMLIR